MEYIVFGIVVIAISIVLFVALRQLMLWYWKVDTIIKNQELTNKLLSNNNALLNEQILFTKSQLKPENEPNQGYDI